MTTSKSPPSILLAQARKIAAIIKATPVRSNGQEHYETAVIMDDKIVKVRVEWDDIGKTSVEALTDLIFRAMSSDDEPESIAPPYRKLH